MQVVNSLTRPVSLLRCMVGYRQPPASTIPSANRNCTARWLPQSPAVTAPSRRELWVRTTSHWVVLLGKCLLCIPQSRLRRASSLWQGSLWCSADTGRVREVTIPRRPPCALTAAARRPSVKNQRFLPAPFDKGAFGCTADTGRVREVTIRRKPPCALTAAARRPFGKGAFGGA